MTTKTKTKTKVNVPSVKVEPAKDQQWDHLKDYERQAREINNKIGALEKRVHKTALQAIEHHKALGDLFIRIRDDWKASGKPIKMVELYAKLGTTSATWSRYIRFATWCQDNDAKLSALSDEQRAVVMMEQLRGLRSQKKKADEAMGNAGGERKTTSHERRESLTQDQVNAQLNAIAQQAVKFIIKETQQEGTLDNDTDREIMAQIIFEALNDARAVK